MTTQDGCLIHVPWIRILNLIYITQVKLTRGFSRLWRSYHSHSDWYNRFRCRLFYKRHWILHEFISCLNGRQEVDMLSVYTWVRSVTHTMHWLDTISFLSLNKYIYIYKRLCDEQYIYCLKKKKIKIYSQPFNYFRWREVVCFVGIVDNLRLNFFFG